MTPEQEQLLVYVSAKLAVVESMLSVALPGLIATTAPPAMEDTDPRKKEAVLAAVAASQAYAESLAPLVAREVEFFCEQFPHLARQMRSLVELSSRDRISELKKMDEEEGA